MRIGGLRLGWLRRRWWVVAGSIAAVTAVALLAQAPTTGGYTAEAVLIVRSGATTNTPGNANEANRLAVTYSQLIPQDSLVLERAGRTLNVDRSEVQRNSSVVNDPATSILRVRYTAATSEVAVNGARALADALAGVAPVSSNFNGLALSRLPESATRDSRSQADLPAALVAGLCLGLVLVVAWERAQRRIEDAGDLERELDRPVTELQGLSVDAIEALLERWRILAEEVAPAVSPVNVAIVGCTPGRSALTAEVAKAFVTSGTSGSGGPGPAPEAMGLLIGGAPGTREVGEAVAQRAQLTVLVVAEGTTGRAVERAVASLANFGVLPAWALFASSTVVRRADKQLIPGESASVAGTADSRPTEITLPEDASSSTSATKAHTAMPADTIYSPPRVKT